MLDYSLFAAQCLKYGYHFEPYVVKTDDLWNLTVFRITGYINDEGKQAARDKLTGGKLPTVAITGSFGDA